MIGEDASFVSRAKLSELRSLVQAHVTENKPIQQTKRLLTKIEKAEWQETLGILEFHEGNWHQAAQALSSSLGDYTEVEGQRRPSQLCFAFILASICQFRLGDFHKALSAADSATRVAEANSLLAVAAHALTNRAMILNRVGRISEAITSCRRAIDYSSEENDPDSFEHLEHARALVRLYIRSRDYEKAEDVVDAHAFSAEEKSLLRGGVHFAAGNTVKAGDTLMRLLSTQGESAANRSNLASGSGKRNSIISTVDIENAIKGIESELDTWSLAAEDSLMLDDGSLGEDSLQRKSVSDESLVSRIERIVERSMILFNASMFLPPPPPPDKTKKSGTNPANTMLQPAAVLAQHAQQHIKLQQLAMESLKKFARRLRKRRNLAFDHPDHDSFLQSPWNMYPDVLPYDLYMYPAVCWAVMLLAKAETSLHQELQFRQGLMIGRGEVVLSTDNSYNTMYEQAENSFAKALQVIEASRFHGGLEEDGQATHHKKKPAAVPSSTRTSMVVKEDNSPVVPVVETPPVEELHPSRKSSKSVKSGSTAAHRNSKSSTRSSMAQKTTNRRSMMAPAAEVLTAVDEDNVSVEEKKPDDDDVEALLSKLTDYDHQLSDITDVSIVKDALLNVQQFFELNSSERSNRVAMANAAKVLTRNGVVEFNPWTGQHGNHILPPTTHTGGKKDDGKTHNVGGRLPHTGPEEVKPKAGVVSASYQPKTHDPLSYRSEFTVGRSTIGNDEVVGWIQWALGSVGGISMGFLGMSAMSAEELLETISADEQHAKTMAATSHKRPDSLNTSNQATGPRLPESFLMEVRNRLLDADHKLTQMNDVTDPMFDDEDASLNNDGQKPSRGGEVLLSRLTPGQLESRVLLLFVLIKVTAQLCWKKDVLPLLLQIEKTYEQLKTRYSSTTAYRYEVQMYGVLVQKFRLEYEQWLQLSSQLLGDEERAEITMLQILPRAKKYYFAASEMMAVTMASNLNVQDPLGLNLDQRYLMKDAMKKLSNVYISIGNIPLKAAAPGMGGAARRPTAAQRKVDSAEPGAVGGIIPPGTLQDLEKFTLEEILEKEKSDVRWLQRFGRVRAQVVFSDFKSRFCNLNSSLLTDAPQLPAVL